MAELKTQPNDASVSKFLASIEDDGKRKDARAVAAMMRKATGAKPRMWGPSIVGFGHYTYVNSTKKPQAWFRCGFSPRKQALTLYLIGGYPKDAATAKKLGKFTTGASCLYIKSLDDVHVPTLKALLQQSLRRLA
jgi:hypothetical protein